MRRPARHLFTLCSAVSLLLCVATCVLWVRSYWTYDEWRLNSTRGGRPGLVAFSSADGRLLFIDTIGLAYRPGEPVHVSREPFPLAVDNQFNSTWLKRHFGYRVRVDTSPPIIGRGAWLPHWAVAAALACPPVLWWGFTLRRRNRWRLSSGLCVRCGYDLRASPKRCPECGTAAAK